MSGWPFGGPAAQAGVVHLVGGGPGDPGLLSLRAARLLASATLVAYDRLAPPEALGLCPPGCELVYVGKSPDRHALSQEDINRLLVERARRGDAVVRLKGGDPFVLGRGSEEAQACVAAGVAFEVVPGVSSATAAPAYAGIPVTHRGLAPGFAVVTGHEDPGKSGPQVDYPALAAFPGTLVLLMGVGRVGAIARELVSAGKPADTPVALVRWGSTARQETLRATLGDVAERVARSGFSAPAVTVVGEVAALRDQIAWFEHEHLDRVRRRRPLHGVSVLVARSREQASALAERLRALGAEPVEAPTIAVEPAADPEPLRRAVQAVGEGHWDWLVLTSANAVRAVWEQVEALGADARLLAGARLAVVGPGSDAELAVHGLRADLVAPRQTAAALGDALVTGGRPGRALLPRGDLASPALPGRLREAGWQVTEVQAYRTVQAAHLDDGVRRRLRAGDVDVLAFASSSTARNLVALLGGPPHPRSKVAAIGPVTAAACRELGLRVDTVAEPHDLDGLVAAVTAAARSR